MRHRLLGLFTIVILLISPHVFAERYPPLENGMVTKKSVLDENRNIQTYIEDKIPQNQNEAERNRDLSIMQDWLNFLSPYVQLVKVTSINEMEQLFPKKVSWDIQQGNLSFYYHVISETVATQFSAALFQKKDGKLSFITTFYSDTYIDYNYKPIFYHRKLNGKDVLMLHIHGVMSGNGAIDAESLYIVESDGSLAPVDVSQMHSQLSSSLKSGCYINRGHSKLSDKSFLYSGGVRCPNGEDFITAQYDLHAPDHLHPTYFLEIAHSTIQATSLSSASNQQGVREYKKSKYINAIKFFNQAIQQYPTVYEQANYDAYANLGLALFKAGRIHESIKASEIVWHKEGSRDKKIQGNAAYNLGKAYEALGFSEKAYHYYLMSYVAKNSSTRKASVERFHPVPEQYYFSCDKEELYLSWFGSCGSYFTLEGKKCYCDIKK